MRMILIRNKPGTSYRKAQADCIYRGIKYADGWRGVWVWVRDMHKPGLWPHKKLLGKQGKKFLTALNDLCL